MSPSPLLPASRAMVLRPSGPMSTACPRTSAEWRDDDDPGRSEGFAPVRGILAYLPNPRTFGVRMGARF